MATAAQWIQGARLRTLPAAIAPVLIGSAAAYEMDSFILLNAVLAALVALLLQIGVNYANDYSDGIRGTDEDRVGPLRLVGSGAASPEHVKRAAFAAFGLAMLFGLILVIITQAWWLILVGVGCVLAAWGYTGGKNPYGYLGLGDVFVFVFFGLVATLGTTYTQAGQLSLAAIIGAIGTGLIACALLMANNVRDIPTDRKAGKKTLAVRLGDKHARESYVLMLAVAILLVIVLAPARPWMLIVLLLIPASLMPSWLMIAGRRRKSLIPVLKQTGLINLGFAALFSLGPRPEPRLLRLDWFLGSGRLGCRSPDPGSSSGACSESLRGASGARGCRAGIFGAVVRADGNVGVLVHEAVFGLGVSHLAGAAHRLGLAREPVVERRGGRVALLLEEQEADGEGHHPGAQGGQEHPQLQVEEERKQGRKQRQPNQGVFEESHTSSLAARTARCFGHPAPRGRGAGGRTRAQ